MLVPNLMIFPMGFCSELLKKETFQRQHLKKNKQTKNKSQSRPGNSNLYVLLYDSLNIIF